MTTRTADPPRIIWAVTAAYTIGVLGGNMQPLLIGALMDGLHMDGGSAGLLGSIELGAVALSSFALAPRMGTISRRLLSCVGAVLAVLGYGGSMLAASFASLAVCRVAAGVGAGMVLAIGNAAVSACRHPERVYAQMTIAGTVALTALLALLPLAIARFAYRGGYGGMAAIALALLPALLWIPDTISGTREHVEIEPVASRLGVATLLAAGLLFFAQSGVWAFAERIGTRAQLNHTAIGVVLASSTLAGLCGAGLANRVGTEYGRTLPLSSGMVATGLTLLALGSVRTPRAYTVLLILNGIAYLFMVPYILGVAAALDRQGRWAAATIGAATVGAALGPGVVGPVIETHGYAAMAWVVFAAAMVAAIAVTPVARALDRRDDVDS